MTVCNSRSGLICLVTLALLRGVTNAAPPGPNDWPGWRGPNSNGVAAAGQNPPTEWGPEQNVVWRTPVPGRGHSSPTIVGDQIFLTTADETTAEQSVLCFSRTDGRLLWQTLVSRGGFPKTHPKNTHASPSVACDGDRLFTTFHHHEKLTLACLDRAGNVLWTKTVCPYHPQRYEYGYAASPLIYGQDVIIAADIETGGVLAAFDRQTGAERWRTHRPQAYSFSSPVAANVAGREQILLCGGDLVAAYNPQNGKLLWSVEGTTMATSGTMVWDGDLVMASGGYPKGETICVQADGSRRVRWRNNVKCYEQSLVAADGYVYAFSDQGIAYCWRAADGEEMWKERLGGPVAASPVLVGDLIYAANESGTTFVFRTNPEKFELVARNQLGEESFATLSVCGDRIYMRVASGSGANREESLYCLGRTD